jgi:hypothetical protein
MLSESACANYKSQLTENGFFVWRNLFNEALIDQYLLSLVTFEHDNGINSTLRSNARIDEAISIERSTDINFDELLLKIRNGKGGKERLVPQGFESLQVHQNKTGSTLCPLLCPAA